MISRDCTERRGALQERVRRLPPWLLGWILALAPVAGPTVYAAPQEAPEEAPAAAFEGLWGGQILYAPAEIELEVWVELASDAEGRLVGNIDVPSQKMKFYPLTSVTPEGRGISFDFHKDSERTMNARFLFEGELSEDGGELTGIFTGWYDDEGRNRVPFELKRVEAAFGERPEPVLRTLTSFEGAATEVREAFNEEADKVRVVVLLSPT